MENRLRLFLLSVALLGPIAPPGVVLAQSPTQLPGEEEPLFQPQVERRTVDISALDTENFEIGPFLGFLSIEDFGVNSVAGARLSYHITEDFFVDTSLGVSKADKTSYELLSGAAQLLTDAQRDYTYYNVSLGYNLFSGESFFGARRAFNSALYLLGGIGSTEFGGGDRFTVSAGLGYRFIATDWLAIHVMMRDHIFQHDLFGVDKTSHNFEVQSAIMFFF